MQFKRAGNKIQCLIYNGYDSIKKRSKQRLIATIAIHDDDIPEALHEWLTDGDLPKLKAIRESCRLSDNSVIRQSDSISLYVSQTMDLSDSIKSTGVILNDSQRVAILTALDQLKATLQIEVITQRGKFFNKQDAAAALGVSVRSKLLERAKKKARLALGITEKIPTDDRNSAIYEWIIANKAQLKED